MSGSAGVKTTMTKRRVYIDANVWIEAVQGDDASAGRALALLDAEDIQAVISDYIVLETLPKPQFHRRHEQVALFQQLFSSAERLTPDSMAVMEQAIRLAGLYDLSPMDALHSACALLGGVDELITLEKPGKPFFRIPELRARSIYRESGTP
jgi:predicted nucleic acid-binding protein